MRDLRLHRLLGELSGLSSGLPPGLDIAVESFAIAARAAVARGDAGLYRARFAELLRESGERLRGYGDLSEPMKLAGAFERATRALDDLATAEALPAPVPKPAGGEPPVVPIESLAPDEDLLPIVPIESLLYEEPAASGAAAPADEGWDLAATFGSYEALVRGVAPAVPAMAAPAAPEPPRVTVPPPDIVDITELLYRGPRALAEANRVRLQIRAAVASDHAPGTIQPLFDELLDLVELAAAG